MCDNCTSYDSTRTEKGETFTNGKLSFRVYEFNADNEDYTLFYYICDKGEWILKYPVINPIPLYLEVALQQNHHKKLPNN